MNDMVNEVVAALTRLKKSIDEYEKILDLTKIILNEVKAYGDSDKINRLANKLYSLYKELKEVGDEIASYDKSLTDDYTWNYIETLAQYVALVSLPYEKDLLNDIREIYLRNNNTEKVAKVDKILEFVTKLEEVYASFINVNK